MIAAYVAAGLIFLWALWFFNTAVRYRHRVRDAFSGVDVQLKRRHDLVPNLVATVKAYARHEEETLTRVTDLRGQAQAAAALPDRAESETGLRAGIDRLLVLVEQYPELKADANFRRLGDQLVEIEDDLQYARRYYNGAVREYNVWIHRFPGTVLSPLFGFREEPYFQMEETP